MASLVSQKSLTIEQSVDPHVYSPGASDDGDDYRVITTSEGAAAHTSSLNCQEFDDGVGNYDSGTDVDQDSSDVYYCARENVYDTYYDTVLPQERELYLAYKLEEKNHKAVSRYRNLQVKRENYQHTTHTKASIIEGVYAQSLIRHTMSRTQVHKLECRLGVGKEEELKNCKNACLEMLSEEIRNLVIDHPYSVMTVDELMENLGIKREEACFIVQTCNSFCTNYVLSLNYFLKEEFVTGDQVLDALTTASECSGWLSKAVDAGLFHNNPVFGQATVELLKNVADRVEGGCKTVIKTVRQDKWYEQHPCMRIGIGKPSVDLYSKMANYHKECATNESNIFIHSLNLAGLMPDETDMESATFFSSNRKNKIEKMLQASRGCIGVASYSHCYKQEIEIFQASFAPTMGQQWANSPMLTCLETLERLSGEAECVRRTAEEIVKTEASKFVDAMEEVYSDCKSEDIRRMIDTKNRLLTGSASPLRDNALTQAKARYVDESGDISVTKEEAEYAARANRDIIDARVKTVTAEVKVLMDAERRAHEIGNACIGAVGGVIVAAELYSRRRGKARKMRYDPEPPMNNGKVGGIGDPRGSAQQQPAGSAFMNSHSLCATNEDGVTSGFGGDRHSCSLARFAYENPRTLPMQRERKQSINSNFSYCWSNHSCDSVDFARRHC